jgi:hypothetical protein
MSAYWDDTRAATLVAMGAATIRIFLADGNPLGIRVIEKSNWTGQAIDFARTDWPTARTRDAFGRPGVYVLHGLGDDGTVRVYIGEADELRTRLNQHYSGPNAKEFWTRAVAFASKDANLNKAHVKFLEARLVSLGQAAKRAKIENGNAPALPALSEPDRADAEAFLDEMLVIYPLLGVDAFAPATVASSGLVLSLKGARGAVATGRDTASGFVVLAGSRATFDEVKTTHAFISAQRATLIANGVLVADAGTYLLTQDYTFSSPSTAAAVMLGRTANGRIEWKDATGRTLKAIQDAAGAS